MERVRSIGEKNHLENVLSETEITAISKKVANKINTYIDQKFEEYLTSKALHETSKTQIEDKILLSEAQILELSAKYEETAQKLFASDKTNLELGKQLESLNDELQKARDKIARLENELISMKSARDAAVDERNDLTRIFQRGDAAIERLTSSEATLAQQLKAAIDEKCEVLARNDKIQSTEISLQYSKKRIEQERTLLNSQNAVLIEKVNKLTLESQVLRLNNTSRLVTLETQLAEKVVELNVANETISHLNEVKRNLDNRIENFIQRLAEQREIENKMTENYNKELYTKSKLADLFKSMYDDAEAKSLELTDGITELQKLLNEATEKYGDLETKYEQAELDHEEMLEKKNEVIASLKSKLEHANDLLKAANAHNLDTTLSDLAPSAAIASKLQKSGMSLTQIYSQLVKVSEELAQEKEDNSRLQNAINAIFGELEEKAPILQKQKAEYEEALITNTALTQQIECLHIECNMLRNDYRETSEIANNYNRENFRLKGELADLGRQVCFLLKEIEHSRGGLPNGDHDSSQTAPNTSSESSHIRSKTLVTFSNIQELQSNNQKLLCMIRDLTEKNEELERNKEQFESGEMQEMLQNLKNRVIELTDVQDRLTKMVNGFIRERDMFKNLYHDLMKRPDVRAMLDSSDTFTMDTSQEKPSKPAPSDPSVFEVRYQEATKQLELLKEEYKKYKEEKITNERMLYEQINNMGMENAKLTAANSKATSTAEYNNESLKTLQTNISTYKTQITSLEEKNKTYSDTIAKHEASLQYLRDEVLNVQSKLAAAEIHVENLKIECKLLQDSEVRLQTEKEMVNHERQGQPLLLKNLELIKASLERVEVETRAKLESRLDEATRECAALRRRLQEEQDRFRKLGAHLDRQTETAKARMQEEKDPADALRKEVVQLRDDLAKKNKLNEELAKKLQVALSPNSDRSFDTMKKIRDLESNSRGSEIKALQEQLAIAKEHIKQYCNKTDGLEKELKALHKFRDQLTKIQAQLDAEKANNEKLKQKLESLRTDKSDREEKTIQALKQADSKLCQLAARNNLPTRKLNESRSKSIEQSNRDEQDVRLALIKSQYEGRLTRLDKKLSEAKAEKAREVEALLQKVNLLQRQLASQASASKQQSTTEKTTTDTPTANIKPMAGVAQQSVKPSRRTRGTPLASIQPKAQVGPTAPHEYMPASSSRPTPRAALAATTAPPQTTQPSGASSASAANVPARSAPTPAPSVTSGAASQPPVPPRRRGPASSGTTSAAPSQAVGSASTSFAQPDARPQKRRLEPHLLANKRLRVQGFERSVQMEYQDPTSSRCDQKDQEDQDDEHVIVVISEEDDERCSGTMYMESPAQSPKAGEEGDEGKGSELGDSDSGSAAEVDSDTPLSAYRTARIEAISSGTERGEGSENREWNEPRGEEEAAAVSTARPRQQLAEEGHNAEASAPPAASWWHAAGGPPTPHRTQPEHPQGLMHAADSESGPRGRGSRGRGSHGRGTRSRGRGVRPRGRPPRRYTSF